MYTDMLLQYKQELSLKRLVGRVEEINTTLDFIFQYLVIRAPQGVCNSI